MLRKGGERNRQTNKLTRINRTLLQDGDTIQNTTYNIQNEITLIEISSFYQEIQPDFL